MIFTENLDHNPQAVTLEKLPDGTAWLYLRKDAHEVRTEAPEGEQGGTSWECTMALCKLGSDYAEETVESITRRLMIGGSMQKHGRPLMKLRPLWKSV